MKVWVVNIENEFLGVYSSKEKAVTAIVEYCDYLGDTDIIEFSDDYYGFDVFIRWNCDDPKETITKVYPVCWMNVDETAFDDTERYLRND